MGWYVEWVDGHGHTMPMFDLRDHTYEDCWCKPTAEPDRPDILVHHSADRREYTIEMGVTQ